jgi:MFS family permease
VCYQRSVGRPSAVRWWGTILALAAAFVGAGVARFQLPTSLVEKGLVAGDAHPGDPELARALAEFLFNDETMGWVLSAFVLGYALFQVPGGWVGDRYGPRGVMTVAILWWSLFTAGTAIAPRLPLVGWFGLAWSFAIVRFLIGVGEAVEDLQPFNAREFVEALLG